MMKKRKIVSFLLVMCMAASLLLTGCGDKSLNVKDVESDPISYLKKGGEIVEKAWNIGDGQLTQLIESVMEKGQIEFNLDMTDYTLKNVLSIDGDTMANELTGSIAGQDVDLMAYLDGKDFTIRSNTLLGSEDTYGLNFDAFFEQGTESNLAKLFELEQADLDALKELLEGEGDSENPFEVYKQKIETVEEDIWKLYQAADITVAEEKVTIDGTEVDAITISVPMTTEFIKSMMDTVFGLFEDIEGFDESFAELQTELENIQSDGTYVYYLNKETGALMQCNADFTMKDDEDTTVVEKMGVIYGVDPTTSGKIDMNITAESEGNGEIISMVGTLTKATENKTNNINLEFAINLDGEKINLTADLNYNTDSKEYTLDVTMGDTVEEYAFTLTGLASVDKNAAEFSIASFKMDGVTIDTNISIKLTTEVTMPEKPEYVDLLTLDDETLSDLIMNVYLNMASIGSAGYYDDSYYTDTGYDTTECDLCYNEATQEVLYLGEYWSVCDDCAQDIAEQT